MDLTEDFSQELTQNFDVIIIGGGVVGSGIARDLSLRELKVLLIEKKDLAEGTTGRCHGMLHSGARYVSTDPVTAQECAAENAILRKIAPHIINSCDGYFIALTPEEAEYGNKFLEDCEVAGITAEEIAPEEFLRLEPNCNPNVSRVFKVNDGFIDPFLLTYYNALDAKRHGAVILPYCEVRHLILTENEIVGVRYHNSSTNTLENIYGNFIINATGPWAAKLEQDLKLEKRLRISPTQGTLIVMKNRLVNSVINRLHKPGDGDIIVPSHQSVIIGTSAIPTKEQDLEKLTPTFEEIDDLLHYAEELVPDIRKTRMIRYFTGARPLVADNPSPHDASRKFEIIDYEELGYQRFISVFGGKLTTYRLMAEKVSDMVCKKLDHLTSSSSSSTTTLSCQTHTLLLPGADHPYSKEELKEIFKVDERIASDMSVKWGSFVDEMGGLCTSCLDSTMPEDSPRIVCECEKVSVSELKWVHDNLFYSVHTLDDYRRRTRQGMGPCQGQFCYFKLADLEIQWTNKSHAKIMEEMKIALEKRWKTEELVDDMQKRQIKLAKYMYLMGGNL
ncbi:MAG: anaerobic glycerol-3-phosphate dehydrogenase subunit A [Promethearchaeota archaeon]